MYFLHNTLNVIYSTQERTRVKLGRPSLAESSRSFSNVSTRSNVLVYSSSLIYCPPTPINLCTCIQSHAIIGQSTAAREESV